jgi:hypothetical protein
MKKKRFDSEVLKSKLYQIFIGLFLLSIVVKYVFIKQIVSTSYGLSVYVVFQVLLGLFGLFFVGKICIKSFRKSKSKNKWHVLIITPLAFGLVLTLVGVYALQMGLGFSLLFATVLTIPLLIGVAKGV